MYTLQCNPFARGEYARFTFAGVGPAHECAWCGNKKRRLYAYIWWSDDHKSPSRYDDGEKANKFCDFSCFQSYSS